MQQDEDNDPIVDLALVFKKLWKYDKPIIFLCLITIIIHVALWKWALLSWIGETEQTCEAYRMRTEQVNLNIPMQKLRQIEREKLLCENCEPCYDIYSVLCIS